MIIILKPIPGLGRDTSWGNAKSMLTRVGELKKGLKGFKKKIDKVTNKDMKLIAKKEKEFYKEHGKLLNFETIKKVDTSTA